MRSGRPKVLWKGWGACRTDHLTEVVKTYRAGGGIVLDVGWSGCRATLLAYLG